MSGGPRLPHSRFSPRRRRYPRFEARLLLFRQASAKIPEYYIVAPRAVSSKFHHLVIGKALEKLTSK